MGGKKTFYDREFADKKKKKYLEQEVIYYLEVLPINRRSVVLETLK